MASNISAVVGNDLLNKWREKHSNYGFSSSQMIRYAIARDLGYSDSTARRIALAKPDMPIPQLEEVNREVAGNAS